MSNTKIINILHSLINLVGVSAGIILLSIGAVMFLQALLQFYVFGMDMRSYSYKSYELSCKHLDPDYIEAVRLGALAPIAPMPIEYLDSKANDANKKPLNEKEKSYLKKQYDICVKKEMERSKKEYEFEKKSQIATGLAFIAVGVPLIFFYQKTRRRDEV